MPTANPAPQTADALTLATLALCTASYLPDITAIPAAVAARRRRLRPADSGNASGDRCRTATNRTLRS